MNKKIIAAAIAATFVAPVAMAESNVTVYGKIKQSVDFVDMGQSDNVQINDQASRLGFKGSEDLGNGLKGIFQIELSVAISKSKNEFAGTGFNNTVNSAINKSENTGVGGRNAFVGLAGDFGTVLVGRHDHPMKMSTGSLDYFADSQGDYNNAYGGDLVDLRGDGVIAYVSPDFSGFSFAGAIVPGENNDADGISDAYSVAGWYKNGGLFATVAYEDGDSDMDSLRTQTSTAPVSYAGVDYNQTRVGLGYGMDAWAANVVWAQYELDPDVSGTSSVEPETFVISGKYTMGNNVIKAKYFDTDNDGLTEDVDGFAIGLEHNFSKRTQAQLMYVSSSQDDTKVGGVKVADAANDGDIFSVQLNHAF